MCPWETTALQLDIFNKRKQDIDENNVSGLNWRRQKNGKYIFCKISDFELNLALTHTK